MFGKVFILRFMPVSDVIKPQFLFVLFITPINVNKRMLKIFPSFESTPTSIEKVILEVTTF